jgi:hypothetical protein
MTGFEYDPYAVVGERPLDLNPAFEHRYGVGGSIASQLHAAGYYKGLEQAYEVLKDEFADQPETLVRIVGIFIDPNILEGQDIDG